MKLDKADRMQQGRYNIRNKVVIDKQKPRDNKMQNNSQWYKNCIREQEVQDKKIEFEEKKLKNKDSMRNINYD